MSGDTCTCGGKFLDAENFRDHMPCEGSAAERATKTAFSDGGKAERLRLATKMRTDYPLNRHALEWADWIERQ